MSAATVHAAKVVDVDQKNVFVIKMPARVESVPIANVERVAPALKLAPADNKHFG